MESNARATESVSRAPEGTPTISAAPHWIRLVLWLSMFVIFAASPVVYLSDSNYSMLTAESLIRHGTPDLSSYKIPHFESNLPFNTVQGHHAYQLQRTNGRLLYGFPHGTSFLSAPFVAVLGLFGISASTPDNQFNLFGEVLLQKLIAAALMATFVVVSMQMATLVLSWRWGLIVAIGAGLGTQVWSIASRGMWSHTWEITLGIVAACLLLRSEVKNVSVRPAILATLLSWMYFVRPTAAIPVASVSVYVLLYRREEFVVLVLTGIGWLVAIEVYTLGIFGAIVPFYYAAHPSSLRAIPTGLYGLLLSPSRGFFIYSPVFAVVFYWVIRYRRDLPCWSLAALSLITIAGLLFVASVHIEWWGGACYGPRLLTDALPWLVLLATLAIAAIPPPHRTLRNPSIAVAAVALALSIALNGLGAVSWATERWNYTGPYPGAMLDWSRPQFLAPWMGF